MPPVWDAARLTFQVDHATVRSLGGLHDDARVAGRGMGVGGAGCASPPPGPGPASSPPRLPACKPTHPAYQPQNAPTTRKDKPQGPWNPPTRRDSRAVRHGQTPQAAAIRGLNRTTQDHEISMLAIRRTG